MQTECGCLTRRVAHCSMASAACGATFTDIVILSIDQAIVDQLQRVAHVTSLGMSNSTTIELVKRLVDDCASIAGMCFLQQRWRMRG